MLSGCIDALFERLVLTFERVDCRVSPVVAWLEEARRVRGSERLHGGGRRAAFADGTDGGGAALDELVGACCGGHLVDVVLVAGSEAFVPENEY